ncbi:methionine ABC transporter permease [Caldanaerobius polysaccharolyticus]|uniref:methionine ABC transporter permease n=1 Tax=Caldanaerobius polysaccharolyticus TaxID=44256 RepID=UPI000557F660|nr:methionine ABC transporter permease [Caldanaerobius polysaccharolyticus]
MNSIINEFVNLYQIIAPSLIQTVYMVFFSTLFAVLFGAPLGIILVITRKGNIWEKPRLNSVLGVIINTARSVPFIILMIAIFPISRFIVGTTIGTTAAIVPLALSATPFVARVIESSLLEVNWGVIEASLSMGASIPQIIFKVLLPEARSSLVLGITLTVINIIGYSAMAGAIGGGGLGDLAIRYGYMRFQTDVLVATIVILIIMVQVIQSTGNYIAAILNKK